MHGRFVHPRGRPPAGVREDVPVHSHKARHGVRNVHATNPQEVAYLAA